MEFGNKGGSTVFKAAIPILSILFILSKTPSTTAR